MSPTVSLELNVDGLAVGFTTGGDVDLDAGNPVALLVHGAGMNRTVWYQQTRYLNHHGVSALAIDLPGHGNSAGGASTDGAASTGGALKSIGEMADWLVRLIDEVRAQTGVGAVGLVGHSMGSIVSLCAAAAAGDKVSHLVLTGMAMAMPVHPDLLAAAQSNNSKAGALMTAWGLGPNAHVSVNPTPGLWMSGGSRALLDVADDDVIFTDLAACNEFDLADIDLAGVTCPVSFICGGADKMTPPDAASGLIASFDGASVHFLNGIGHMMMNEDPKSVREILLDALSSASG